MSNVSCYLLTKSHTCYSSTYYWLLLTDCKELDSKAGFTQPFSDADLNAVSALFQKFSAESASEGMFTQLQSAKTAWKPRPTPHKKTAV